MMCSAQFWTHLRALACIFFFSTKWHLHMSCRIHLLYSVHRFRCERPHIVFESIAIHPIAALALADSFFMCLLKRSFLSKWIPSHHMVGVTRILVLKPSHSVSSIWVIGSPHFLCHICCIISCLSWFDARPAFQSHWSTILYALAKSVMFDEIDVEETVSL